MSCEMRQTNIVKRAKSDAMKTIKEVMEEYAANVAVCPRSGEVSLMAIIREKVKEAQDEKKE